MTSPHFASACALLLFYWISLSLSLSLSLSTSLPLSLRIACILSIFLSQSLSVSHTFFFCPNPQFRPPCRTLSPLMYFDIPHSLSLFLSLIFDSILSPYFTPHLTSRSRMPLPCLSIFAFLLSYASSLHSLSLHRNLVSSLPLSCSRLHSLTFSHALSFPISLVRSVFLSLSHALFYYSNSSIYLFFLYLSLLCSLSISILFSLSPCPSLHFSLFFKAHLLSLTLSLSFFTLLLLSLPYMPPSSLFLQFPFLSVNIHLFYIFLPKFLLINKSLIFLYL